MKFLVALIFLFTAFIFSLKALAEYDVCRIFFKNISVTSCMISGKTMVVR